MAIYDGSLEAVGRHIHNVTYDMVRVRAAGLTHAFIDSVRLYSVRCIGYTVVGYTVGRPSDGPCWDRGSGLEPGTGHGTYNTSVIHHCF
eukprot:scaffold18507_cov146-Skeletonema_marinoi.AAC.1